MVGHLEKGQVQRDRSGIRNAPTCVHFTTFICSRKRLNTRDDLCTLFLCMQNVKVVEPVQLCRKCSCWFEDEASGSEMFLPGLGCTASSDPENIQHTIGSNTAATKEDLRRRYHLFGLGNAAGNCSQTADAMFKLLFWCLLSSSHQQRNSLAETAEGANFETRTGL